VSPTEKPAVVDVWMVLVLAEGVKADVRTADVPSSFNCTVTVELVAPELIGSSSSPSEERAAEKVV
jgi:hypothetical protein